MIPRVRRLSDQTGKRPLRVSTHAALLQGFLAVLLSPGVTSWAASADLPLPESRRLTIVIASDSTAAAFPPNDTGGRWGWGQVLAESFDSRVTISNLAASGRSSLSFRTEGRWQACLDLHADYFFIQFGHNDGKKADPARYTDPETAFKSSVSNYIAEARQQGGQPILLTPPTRRRYSPGADHEIVRDDLQDYARSIRELSASMDVPLLDVLPESITFFQQVGRSNAPAYQADDLRTPPPNDDATHFNEAGAREHCRLVIQSLINNPHPALSPLREAVRLR